METPVRASPAPAPPPPTDCLGGRCATSEVDSSRLSLTCPPTQPSALPLGPRPLRFLVRLLGRGTSRPSVSALSTAEAASDDESSSSIGCSPRGGSCDGGSSVEGGFGASCQQLAYGGGRLALLAGEESGREDDDVASCAVEVGHGDESALEQQHSGGWRIRGVLRAPLRLLHGIANVIGHVARAVASKIGPQGPGDNDKTWVERAMNVTTCVPFLFAGRKILRVCTTLAARQFGALFIGVGLAASLYHSTSGRVRCYTRKLDYWTIAYASTFLRAAVWGPDHAIVQMLMRACIFFKPTLVSTGNFMLVEARYAAMAFSTPSMLPAWCCHAAIGVTATSCFALEDHPVMAGFPYVHAAWHALSAVGFMTLTTFLTQLEGLRAARALVAAC